MEYYIDLDKADTSFIDLLGHMANGSVVSYYSSDGKIKTLCVTNEAPVIESYVDGSNVNFDDNFILVDQKPLDSICECNENCAIRNYKNWHHLRSYKMCAEALGKSTFHKYWIINKNRNFIYGPYSKTTFLNKCREIGVPKTLRIELN